MRDNIPALGLSPLSFNQLELFDDVDDQISLTLCHTGLTSEERSQLEYEADAADQSWFEITKRLGI